MFLKNAWYVAALDDSIGRHLTPLRILGERIVVFRSSSGEPCALADVCPHRKLPLSMGTLNGDAIQCGYHGLTFDGSGTCVAAPTQKMIPRNATVRRYPTCSKYGLVWIWMGDPELADVEAIVEIERFDDPQWKITGGDAMTCQCHYLLLVDNLLDPSHVAWVHNSSFAAAGTEDTNIDVVLTDEGVIASRWILNQDPPPFYAELLETPGKVDRLQHYEVRYPSIAINKSVFSKAGSGRTDNDSDAYVMVSYNFLTPVDENTTQYFWLQHRNSQPDNDLITKKIASGAREAFQEDRRVLEAVQASMTDSATPGIRLGIDAAAVQFRKQLEERVLDEQNGQ